MTLGDTFHGEGTIIKSASHAQAMAMFVESKQWGDNKIEPLWFTYSIMREYRLRYTKAVELHGGVWRPQNEPQASLEEGMQYGQITMFAHVVSEMQQWHRIDLALAADVSGDAS